MKLSPLFRRRVTTLAPCLLTFVWLAACGASEEKTPNPTPMNPQPDASTPNPGDGSVPPPPGLDAGSLMCGTNTCSSGVVGGQLGIACCARNGTTCGLNFGGQCIDQSDAGFTMPPTSDAGVTPDPNCPTVTVDFMGTMFTLSGCCRSDAMCGYFVPQMTGLGCLSIEQLRTQGAPVPDAPVACSADAGTAP